MFKKGKGQAGIEYVMLTALLMVFLIPTINYALQTAVFTVRMNQLENIVRRVAKSVDAVGAIGPGAVEVLQVTIPTGILNTYLNGTEIILNATMFGSTDAIALGATHINVSGSLPTIPGTYHVYVQALTNHEVFVHI